MASVREINGIALHRKLIDVVLVPLIVASLLWIGRTVMLNQTKLVEIDTRLKAMENKTTIMPPADYRSYIDAKFLEVMRRQEEIASLLRDHINRTDR